MTVQQTHVGTVEPYEMFGAGATQEAQIIYTLSIFNCHNCATKLLLCCIIRDRLTDDADPDVLIFMYQLLYILYIT